MNIDSVAFVMSAGNSRECPEEMRAEIAMSGRSNVGKSSLLNSLFRRKGMALVSSTPGKTQRLNYFIVNDEFHVVDLPGYGYAKAPGSTRNQWGQMMQEYLRTRRQLVAVVQLVDSRHLPSREDREMVQWLRDEQLPFCLVATKMDKLGASKGQLALKTIRDALGLPETQPVLPYSSKTGAGRVELLMWMERALEAATGD